MALNSLNLKKKYQAEQVTMTQKMKNIYKKNLQQYLIPPLLIA